MKKNVYYFFVVSIENIKILKFHAFLEITLIIWSKCKNKDEKYLKKKNRLGY